MERRNDERDRLRAACSSELSELREADDDEQSDVMADVAAKTAARTARQITLPDSEPPVRKRPSPPAIAGAILALGAAATAVVEALRQAGIIK